MGTLGNRLTDVRCRAAGVGIHGDGAGLALQVQPGAHGNRRNWIFRYMIAGRARTMGLGSYPDITLRRAREKAQECRRLKVEGIDPIEHKHAARASLRRAAAKRQAPTFDECASAYVASHGDAWVARHTHEWTRSVKAHVSPVFGDIPVDRIDTALVCRALEPIWRSKTETASRLRGRIEAVLNWAQTRGHRAGENPARWKGHLQHILTRPKAPPVHFASMPYSEVPGFMAQLRVSELTSAYALQFLILTAARSGEALGARWDEIDVAGRTWTIPANRMKAGKEHRVPLSRAAVEVLERVRVVQTSEYVFPGLTRSRMSASSLNAFLYRIECPFTVHGFRSSFRDWCAERTNYPREICEQALAHRTGSAVELSYRRTDYFAQRAKLMQSWSDFCDSRLCSAEVVPLRA
jgi:integrase